jgi:hypothetical protein
MTFFFAFLTVRVSLQVAARDKEGAVKSIHATASCVVRIAEQNSVNLILECLSFQIG